MLILTNTIFNFPIDGTQHHYRENVSSSQTNQQQRNQSSTPGQLIIKDQRSGCRYPVTTVTHELHHEHELHLGCHRETTSDGDSNITTGSVVRPLEQSGLYDQQPGMGTSQRKEPEKAWNHGMGDTAESERQQDVMKRKENIGCDLGGIETKLSVSELNTANKISLERGGSLYNISLNLNAPHQTLIVRDDTVAMSRVMRSSIDDVKDYGSHNDVVTTAAKDIISSEEPDDMITSILSATCSNGTKQKKMSPACETTPARNGNQGNIKSSGNSDVSHPSCLLSEEVDTCSELNLEDVSRCVQTVGMAHHNKLGTTDQNNTPSKLTLEARRTEPVGTAHHNKQRNRDQNKTFSIGRSDVTVHRKGLGSAIINDGGTSHLPKTKRSSDDFVGQAMNHPAKTSEGNQYGGVRQVQVNASKLPFSFSGIDKNPVPSPDASMDENKCGRSGRERKVPPPPCPNLDKRSSDDPGQGMDNNKCGRSGREIQAPNPPTVPSSSTNPPPPSPPDKRKSHHQLPEDPPVPLSHISRASLRGTNQTINLSKISSSSSLSSSAPTPVRESLPSCGRRVNELSGKR